MVMNDLSSEKEACLQPIRPRRPPVPALQRQNPGQFARQMTDGKPKVVSAAKIELTEPLIRAAATNPAGGLRLRSMEITAPRLANGRPLPWHRVACTGI